MPVIYLDNAATSWPKPPEVTRAMCDFLERTGGNPGRSGHSLSIAAGRVLYGVREQVAELFGVSDPLRVIFTLNATHALNLALKGLLHPGDGVVTTGMEHNAVMRPLRRLEGEGVHLTVVPCRRDGTLDPAAVEEALRPDTKLIAMNHASNVVGTLLPVGEVAAIAHCHGLPLLVDAAQTGGALPLDMGALGIDLLAFTGHKSLLGPPGTGGLVLGPHVDPDALAPLYEGGTGSRSESQRQPPDLPDRYESGTPNGVGIAGLGAGIAWVQQRGVEAIRQHEQTLTKGLIEGLSAIPGVTVYGTLDPARSVAVVSFTAEGQQVSEIGLRLDEEHGVLCRVGLHCAPAAHRTIGTFPSGTVRLAPGPFTFPEDVERAVEAVAQVVRS
ncbi:MAG: aminotransferase class V-fold PLP-dependent enzyme [Anaerolineae bacterium]|nr:aminotransferase class V-fold PLP-dependent enzyme [Anaerolineae bacterium]